MPNMLDLLFMLGLCALVAYLAYSHFKSLPK